VNYCNVSIGFYRLLFSSDEILDVNYCKHVNRPVFTPRPRRRLGHLVEAGDPGALAADDGGRGRAAPEHDVVAVGPALHPGLHHLPEETPP
jgi:hypothetical protein